MIIELKELTFIRLQEQHIELVRAMRNAPSVKKHMQFKKHITTAMQKQWFLSIDTIYNYYFIIFYNNKAIGLINSKNINYKKGTYEAGMFIYDESLWQSPIPALCSLIMSDFHFHFLKLKRNTIQILVSNKKAIAYNKLLGYKPVTRKKNILHLLATQRSYTVASDRIKKALLKEKFKKYEFKPSAIKLNNESEEQLINLYRNKLLPKHLRDSFSEL